MATATNTTLGEIRLSGDLGGSNNGLTPTLSATGVTPGSYTLPAITVDAKGRITAASNGDLSTILPIATGSTLGLVKIGANVSVTGGLISVEPASTGVYGVVKVNTGTGLSVSSGAISFDASSIPAATTSTLGAVRIGAGVAVDGGVISTVAVADASTISKGVVRIGDNIAVSGGMISIPPATSASVGLVKPGNGLAMSGNSIILDGTNLATNSTPGLVRLGTNIIDDGSGRIGVALPIATTTTAGLVKIGSGLNVDPDGLLTNTSISSPPIASASSLGLVKIGANIAVDGAGSISIADATTSVKGVVRVGTVGITVADNTVDAVLATNSTFGIVKPDGTGDITVSSGQLSIGISVPKTATANTFTKTQTTALVDLGTLNGNVTLNLTNGNVQKGTMSGPITFVNVTAAPAQFGAVFHIIVTQGAEGAQSITFGDNFKSLGGFGPVYDADANKTTVLSFIIVSASAFLLQSISGFSGV